MTAKEFDCIYREYWYRLYLYAFHYLHNVQDSEDAVSDTFISLWKNGIKFKNHRSLNGWLYVVCKNKALNIKHRNSARKYLEIEEIDLIYDEPNMDLILIEDAFFKAMVNTIKNMPPQMSRITQMYLFERKKQGEIAKTLQLAKPTINHQLQLAKKRFKELKSHVINDALSVSF